MARAGSSPPSPLSLRAPMRFIAIDSVSCASGLSAPSEMPGASRRLRISVMLSTSSTGIGVHALGAEVEQVAQRDRRLPAHRRRRSGW